MTEKISFPPLRDLPSGRHEARKQHLLTEVAGEPTSRRAFLPPSRSWKSALVVAVLLLTLAGAVSVGIADSLGAFNGISVVQHPQTTSDAIDPATAKYIKTHLAGIKLDTVRHLGQLPNGQNVYVVTGTQNDLCAVLGPPEIDAECGDPLSHAHPATIYTLETQNDPGTRWITYGIALDGVTSVSFPYSTQAAPADGGGNLGPAVTAPVNNNLWIYPNNKDWPPNALQPVTAHFADGTTVTEPATGTNCAAC
jgi:hypothetical protein